MSANQRLATDHSLSTDAPQVVCRLCMDAGEKTVVISNFDRKLLKCRACGVAFLDPLPTVQELSTHFSDRYIKDEERLENTFTKSRDSVLSQVAARTKKRKNSGRILDIGCAGGHFLSHYFPSSDWEKFGVEPSKYASAKAAEKGIKMCEGQVLDANLPTAFFDVVTALDVVCYFARPQQEMEKIRRSLKPDGVLVIELPLAEAQIWRNSTKLKQFVGGKGRSLTHCGHLYFFNQSSIDFLLHATGFRIAEFAPLPGNKQRRLYQDLVFDGYYTASRLLWQTSGSRLMLGPNFLAVATPA